MSGQKAHLPQRVVGIVGREVEQRVLDAGRIEEILEVPAAFEDVRISAHRQLLILRAKTRGRGKLLLSIAGEVVAVQFANFAQRECFVIPVMSCNYHTGWNPQLMVRLPHHETCGPGLSGNAFASASLPPALAGGKGLPQSILAGFSPASPIVSGEKSHPEGRFKEFFPASPFPPAKAGGKERLGIADNRKSEGLSDKGSRSACGAHILRNLKPRKRRGRVAATRYFGTKIHHLNCRKAPLPDRHKYLDNFTPLNEISLAISDQRDASYVFLTESEGVKSLIPDAD